MSSYAFLVALVLGAGALALWVDVRFPRLAPRGLRGRALVAGIAFVAVAAAPISSAGGVATLVTLVGVFLPVLCFALLSALWLLRTVAGQPGASL